MVATLSVVFLAGCAAGSTSVPPSSRLSPSAPTESTPALAATTPTPTSPSRGPYIVDLTWVSDQTGWALSAAECASGLCAELASTIDGGKTWRQLPSSPALIASGTVDCSKAVCISHIRFATRMLGYLYGPALLVTSNGGQSWRPEESLPVEALEPTHGQVYRIVYDHGGCPGPCDRTVEVASAGSAAWRTVLSIPFMAVELRQDSAQLVTQGSQDIYIAIYGDLAAGGGTQQAVLFRSLDAGRTWRRFGDPCGGSGAAVNDAISLAASTGGFRRHAVRAPDRQLPCVRCDLRATEARPGVLRTPRLVPSSQLIAAASPTHLALATRPDDRKWSDHVHALCVCRRRSALVIGGQRPGIPRRSSPWERVSWLRGFPGRPLGGLREGDLDDAGWRCAVDPSAVSLAPRPSSRAGLIGCVLVAITLVVVCREVGLDTDSISRAIRERFNQHLARHHLWRPTPTPFPPAPSGFRPLSLTFVGPTDGWVIGTGACARSCVWIYHTTNGGATWTRSGAPPAYFPYHWLL